jgi:hypothetical protein
LLSFLPSAGPPPADLTLSPQTEQDNDHLIGIRVIWTHPISNASSE